MLRVRGSVLVLMLGLSASPARLLAQYEKFVRFETGAASIHHSRPGPAFGLRIGGSLSADWLRYELGGVYSRADTGFFTGEVGLEARAATRQIAAFVGAATGVVGEVGSQVLTRVTVGLEAPVGWSGAIRVAAQAAQHGGYAGPNTLMVSYEFRL